MSSTRQLAAIMFTDIQGYTALMQQNEEEAIKTRDKHRRIFNSVTEKHNGQILQYYGDGTLSIFDSAIDAVKCGIEMQLGFQEEPTVPVRIGIHTGDIVFSEEEIIGDGVNVASRIESLAVPGSVFISDKVYDEIKNHKSIETSILKTFKLKNVEKPIEVYAISNVGLIVPDPEDIEGKTDPDLASLLQKEQYKSKIRTGVSLTLVVTALIATFIGIYLIVGRGSSSETQGKSIAVLAFENMSSDPDQEYFSDGISEEILNALTKVNGLKVAGRTSAFSFKGQHEDIRTIGEKLDVKMVLEGSVRKAGTQLRITAQLINVEDGFHIWSETYDREMEDIFAIQDEIAAKIVDKLKLEVQKSAEVAIQTHNVEAYDSLLKGIYFLDKDYEGAQKAMGYFQKAVELDPEYAVAYAMIGDTYINYAAYGLMPGGEALSYARTAAQKAISLHEREPRAHKVLAYIHFYYDWDWELALSEYNKAIQYGLPDPDHFITFLDIFVHEDYEHAIRVSEQILERDPLHIESYWHLGFCNLFAGNLEEALAAFDNALELEPNYSEGHRWKGTTLGYMGKFDEALSSLNKALEITLGKGPANMDLLALKVQMGQKEEVMQILEGWKKSGEHIDPMALATLYAMMDMADDAMAWLERGYRERSFMMISLKTYQFWDPYRDDPRFIEIYGKMNFPE